jgi:hypothetical protein
MEDFDKLVEKARKLGKWHIKSLAVWNSWNYEILFRVVQKDVPALKCYTPLSKLLHKMVNIITKLAKFKMEFQ